MAGALDFLDTLVNRAADVSIAKSNADVATARVTDQTKVPYTSPLQNPGALGAYLPFIIGAVVIASAAYLLLRKR